LGQFDSPPKQTFIVHGEPPAQQALQGKIEEMGWSAKIPHLAQVYNL
jgi:metallo-beta-lactamase family protein